MAGVRKGLAPGVWQGWGDAWGARSVLRGYPSFSRRALQHNVLTNRRRSGDDSQFRFFLTVFDQTFSERMIRLRMGEVGFYRGGSV